MNIFFKYSISIVFFFIVFFTSCNEFKSKKSSTIVEFDCKDSIKKLVSLSSYKNLMNENNVDYFINELDTEKIIIHATHLNEDNKNVTVGWIKIDLMQNRMLDITLNPDSPTVIKRFNKELLQKIKTNCIKSLAIDYQ